MLAARRLRSAVAGVAARAPQPRHQRTEVAVRPGGDPQHVHVAKRRRRGAPGQLHEHRARPERPERESGVEEPPVGWILGADDEHGARIELRRALGPGEPCDELAADGGPVDGAQAELLGEPGGRLPGLAARCEHGHGRGGLAPQHRPRDVLRGPLGPVPALPEREVGLGQRGPLEDAKRRVARLEDVVAEGDLAAPRPRLDHGSLQLGLAEVEGACAAAAALQFDVVGHRGIVCRAGRLAQAGAPAVPLDRKRPGVGLRRVSGTRATRLCAAGRELVAPGRARHRRRDAAGSDPWRRRADRQHHDDNRRDHEPDRGNQRDPALAAAELAHRRVDALPVSLEGHRTQVTRSSRRRPGDSTVRAGVRTVRRMAPADLWTSVQHAPSWAQLGSPRYLWAGNPRVLDWKGNAGLCLC